MQPSPETIQRIELYRAKVKDGTITLEELKEGVKFLRDERFKALEASAAKKRKSSSTAKSARTARSADELLEDLGL